MIRKPQQTDTFYKRTAAVTVFLLSCFLAISIKLFNLQIIHGAQTRANAEDLHSIYKTLEPSRGEIKITDKISSQILPVATNKKTYSVYVVPNEIKNTTSTAATLGSILGMDQKDILPKLSWFEKKYVSIKKNITDAERSEIEKSKIIGVNFDTEYARLYPEQNLLSHVLGFVGYNKEDKKVGLYGLERYLEKSLAGELGYISQEQGLGGSWIFGSKRQTLPARDGENVVLTIDKTIQFKAESILKETVTKHGADSGSIIVADPKTGSILAMAGYPDFNPNEFSKVVNSQIFSNEATVGVYEPGSTFKAITMAAALDAGKITPETTYTDTGEIKIDKYTIKNAEGGARGVQTMTQALDLSLNTGAIFALNQIGNAEFFKYVKRFGFGNPTGIQLPESSGNIDNLKGSVQINYFTASFGQGISVTPIQMVQAYGALANGGKMMAPYIVQSVINQDGSFKNTEPKVISQPISEKAANVVSAMLVDVIENGFGKKAAVPGYFLAGKTGTAQVPRKDGKPGYEADDNIGSFIGYGPVEDPRFVILVRVDHPRDVKFAESTAGPAWGQMASFILNYLQVPPTRSVPGH